MLIIGLVVVMAAVLGGFIMAGGQVAVLIQTAEFVVIIGAGIGSILVSNPPSFMGSAIKEVMAVMKPSPFSKQSYLNLLRMLFNVFNVARRDGLLALEPHIEKPEESELFSRCPELIADHHALDFFADTTKVVLSGAVQPHDLMDMMEIDLDQFEKEVTHAEHVIQNLGDAMPGFGIVAAVLGVIITMGSIGGDPASIGHHVAAALVGTMLGVLLAYGVVGPIAAALKRRNEQKMQFMQCLRYALFSFARGESPITCIEFARRNIDPDLRPGFSEMESAVRQKEAA